MCFKGYNGSEAPACEDGFPNQPPSAGAGEAERPSQLFLDFSFEVGVFDRPNQALGVPDTNNQSVSRSVDGRDGVIDRDDAPGRDGALPGVDGLITGPAPGVPNTTIHSAHPPAILR